MNIAQKFLLPHPIVTGSILLAAIVFFAGAPLVASAQPKPALAGDYAGTLGPLHIRLHLSVDASGAITGTLDSVDQGAMGIPCADFHFDGQSLSFTVPAVQGKWSGTVTAGALAGTWDQGSPQPLTFTRDNFVPAAKPSPVDGIWLGALAKTLRVQIVVRSDAAGAESCTLDSLDQGAMGIACANVAFTPPAFSFDVPAVRGHWEGRLSADGASLTGTWSQGSPQPLNFARQAAALAPPPVAPPSYDPAMPPVSAAGLQSVLDNDLAEALKSGQLAPPTGGGVTIGVVEHGVRRVFSYGAAKPDSIFEIGSISKTFTALILAQMVEQGKVHLDDPVRSLLPPGAVGQPAGPEITLLDLATQHSGLPRMPDNFHPADNQNPYVDYRPADLYAFLRQHGVARPADAGFLYSNLGFGLLGQALADRAGLAYPALLQQQVTAPLGLRDTGVVLTREQQARFLQGHSPSHRPAPAWDFDALAGCGAIRSTASDLLTYLQAQLHPGALQPGPARTPAATLASAITLQHQLRADSLPGMKIGLAWLYQDSTGNYWHNGGTGGFSSYAFFNPLGDYAAVVLFNTTIGPEGSFADRLGEHISQRLEGKPAVSLAK